ncbi:carnitine dehydratase [Gammaproteobacteria bacterium 45_16_T64]|nr:carnitine dehydratase [Gammaproteobacteria bacterium 45_16_T64]
MSDKRIDLNDDTDPKPLDGILVVALEQAVAAPYISSRLADAGARVIKIERREGDFARQYDSVVNGESAYFVWLNRGKESIVLNIKDEGDQKVLHNLIEKADVFIQNLAPGAAARVGFDSTQLRARHERLITCDISGYGEDGSYASRKAYDLLIQAETGLSAVTGRPEGPGRVGVSVCDIAAGMHALTGVLQALYVREKTGKGQGIKVSLFDGMADWMTVPLLHQEYGGKAPDRVGMNHPSIAPYGAFEVAGDPDLQVVLSIQNEREWESFCQQVLMMPELLSDPRFKTNELRVIAREDLDELVSRVFSQETKALLEVKLDEAKVAFGWLNNVAQFGRHPQLRRVNVQGENGEICQVASPIRRVNNAGTPHADTWGAVPSVGQQSEKIKQEFGE